MFLFSIVPIPLNSGNDSNIKSPVDKAQDKVLDLEALLTAAILEQPLPFENGDIASYQKVEGVDFSDGVNKEEMQKIRNVLLKARVEEINLRNNGEKNEDLVNEGYRLAEITTKITVADMRVRDLENLLSALVNEQPAHPVSAVDNTDPNAIKDEIERAKAYKLELENAKKYWEEIISSQVEKENSKPTTVGDIKESEMIDGFHEKFGFVGIERMIKLQKLLDSLIKDEPPDLVSGVDNTDANAVRGEIFNTQMHMLMNLKKASDEPWFHKLKDIAAKRNVTVEKEEKAAKAKLKDLEEALNSLINGQQITKTIPGVDVTDANQVRQSIFRMKALVGELQKEKEFMDKVVKYKPENGGTKPNEGQTNKPFKISPRLKQLRKMASGLAAKLQQLRSSGVDSKIIEKVKKQLQVVRLEARLEFLISSGASSSEINSVKNQLNAARRA